MPHPSLSLLLLVLLAGCQNPRQESESNAKAWSRRSWRGTDGPVIPAEGETSRMRAWPRDDATEVEAERVAVSPDEPVPTEPRAVEVSDPTTPAVAPSDQENEPAPAEVEPIEPPEPEQEPPAPADPAPTETPVPQETPTPVDPTRLVDLRASIVLMWYFQRDDDPDTLERGELEEAFEWYDWNKDGQVIELEFEATTGSAEAHGRRPEGEARELLGDVRPLDALLAAVDSDADGAISSSEILAFHDQRFAP